MFQHEKKIYKLSLSSKRYYFLRDIIGLLMEFAAYMIMIMIIFIHKKDTLQITANNKQQSHNLRIPVESYENLFGL